MQTRHSFDLQFSPASSAAQNHFHSSVRGNEVSSGEGAEGLSCGTCNKDCRNVTKNVGTPIVLLPSGNSNTWVSPLLRRALRQWLSWRKLSLSLMTPKLIFSHVPGSVTSDNPLQVWSKSVRCFKIDGFCLIYKTRSRIVVPPGAVGFGLFSEPTDRYQ